MADKIQAVNFRWQRGEDLKIELIYKEGDNTAKAVPVPLGVNYSLRMDLVLPGTNTVVYSVSSDDENSNVTLSTGAHGQPNIVIYLDRSVTLGDGDLFDEIDSGKTAFSYDIFLRNNEIDKQSKILRGTITVEDSHTLWQ